MSKIATDPLMIENAANIEGWMTKRELLLLATMAQEAHTIIEVGCYKGRSTRVLCDNLPFPGRVYAFDPWNGNYYNNDNSVLFTLGNECYEEFRKNVPNINLIINRMPFQVVPHLYADFIFLDGDHRYEAVKRDINYARRMLTAGGILSGHDYGRNDWPGVKKAVDEIFPNATIEESIWWIRL